MANMEKTELRVLTPTGMLGYGFPLDSFREGLKRDPDVITADAGSTDSGPHKLGLGTMTCSREAYVNELEILLSAGLERQIPVFISSAGGDGTAAHVDAFADIVSDLAETHGWSVTLCRIYSDIGKEIVREALRTGKTRPCGPVHELTEEEINAASVIVGQMGAEPYLKALRQRPDIDIIISGRAYDPVPVAALGLLRGFNPGLCWHMGKIMECGALCAEPSGRVLFGTLDETGFTLEPMNPAECCKTYSVAAHTLYEKSHPYLLPGPGGTLDLSGCTFAQVDERRVRVTGSRFIPEKYTVKLEGAKTVGHRSIVVCGIRDPILIGQIDVYLDRAKKDVEETYPELMKTSQVIFHVYGKNGVMGELEPNHAPAFELCVIVETVAETQKDADKLCNKARVSLLHNPYEGRIATAGNIALPFTPLEIPLGSVCAFNIYHLLEVNDPESLFPIRFDVVGRGK